MGEAKRRREQLGESYGKEKSALPGLPITQEQSKKLAGWVTRGTWIAIALTIGFWITLRFIGPGLGWWELSG